MYHPLAFDEFECRDCGAVLTDSLDVADDGRCLDCHAKHAAAERFWRRYRTATERNERNERRASSSITPAVVA